jgi:hypothetical protein
MLSSLLRSPLSILVIITLVRGLIYLSLFPPFLAPDEPAHFEAIRLLGEEKIWPRTEAYQTTPLDPEMPQVFDEFRLWLLVGLEPPPHLTGAHRLFMNYYASQVAGSEVAANAYLLLYHLSLAPLLNILSGLDMTSQTYLLRFVSVLLASATVIITWSTLRAAFPQHQWHALAPTSFIVFWPMHTHVTASINVDALAEVIGALFFFILVAIWQKGWNTFRIAMLATLLGLAAVTKPTLFFLYPSIVAILIMAAGRRYALKTSTTTALVVLLLLATWLASVYVFQNANGGRTLALIVSSFQMPRISSYFNAQALSYFIGSANFAVVSFWGIFGWSNIHLPWTWVRWLALLSGLLMCGALLFVYRRLIKFDPNSSEYTPVQREILIIFLILLLLAFIGVTAPIAATQSPSWGIHARYYFPVVIPLALFLYLSVRELSPRRLKPSVGFSFVMAWVIYDAVVLTFILLPFLYS